MLNLKKSKTKLLLFIVLSAAIGFIMSYFLTNSYDKQARKNAFALERVNYSEIDMPIVRAQQRFIDYVESNYDASVGGGGGSHYRELRIKSLDLSLRRTHSREEMKKMLVDLSERFLDEMNSDPKLIALGKYEQYTLHNIDLTLFNYAESLPLFTSNRLGKIMVMDRYPYAADPGIYEVKSYPELFEEIYPGKQSKYLGTGEEITSEELKKSPLKEVFLALEKKIDLAVEPYDFRFKYGNLRPINSFQRNRNGIKEIYVCLVPLKENRKTPWTPLNLERARKTYLELLQVVLNTVNEDEGIRPHLANYPIRSDQIFFSFEMENMPFKKGDVNDMYKLQNDIVYRDKANSIAIKRESFMEAQQRAGIQTKEYSIPSKNKD